MELPAVLAAIYKATIPHGEHRFLAEHLVLRAAGLSPDWGRDKSLERFEGCLSILGVVSDRPSPKRSSGLRGQGDEGVMLAKRFQSESNGRNLAAHPMLPWSVSCNSACKRMGTWLHLPRVKWNGKSKRSRTPQWNRLRSSSRCAQLRLR